MRAGRFSFWSIAPSRSATSIIELIEGAMGEARDGRVQYFVQRRPGAHHHGAHAAAANAVAAAAANAGAGAGDAAAGGGAVAAEPQPQPQPATPIPIALRLPVSRAERVPSLLHLTRFEILRRVRVDQIALLPLPPLLRQYLGEHQIFAEQ